MSFPLSIFFVILTFSITNVFCGDLKWKEDNISKTISFLEEEVIVEFSVKNKGKNPIKIETVKTSCGCAVAKISSNNLLSGESGKLTISINTTKITGESRKYVTVKTDEPGLTVYQLSVDIFKQIAYSPVVSRIEWEKSNSLESQNLIIRRADGLPFEVEVVRSVSGYPDAVSVEIDKQNNFDGRGKEIVLNIIPLKHGISEMKPINLILKNGDKIINSRLNVIINVE